MFLISYTIEMRGNPEYKPFLSVYKVWLFKNHYTRNYHFVEFKRLLKELGLPDVRWRDLRGTCATQLLLAGISPKAVAKNLGHAKEIVTCNNYVDNAKLTILRLERLDAFISSVLPKQDTEQENDFSNVRIDISEYIPQ